MELQPSRQVVSGVTKPPPRTISRTSPKRTLAKKYVKSTRPSPDQSSDLLYQKAQVVDKLDTNAAEGVNVAGGTRTSTSNMQPVGHKRRKFAASVAALVIGVASLGLRIAELVVDMS